MSESPLRYLPQINGRPFETSNLATHFAHLIGAKCKVIAGDKRHVGMHGMVEIIKCFLRAEGAEVFIAVRFDRQHSLTDFKPGALKILKLAAPPQKLLRKVNPVHYSTDKPVEFGEELTHEERIQLIATVNRKTAHGEYHRIGSGRHRKQITAAWLSPDQKSIYGRYIPCPREGSPKAFHPAVDSSFPRNSRETSSRRSKKEL